MKNRIITKADIVLAVVLLILGIGSPFFINRKADENSRVIISVDGNQAGSYSLYEDRLIALDENGLHAMSASEKKTENVLSDPDAYWPGAYNIVQIKDGGVSVIYADCRGNDCVDMGRISMQGQIIACLPHKMLIIIENTDQGNDPDVVIK